MSIVTKLEAIKQNRIKLANKVKNLGLGDGTENLDVAVTKVDGIEEKGSPVIEVTEGTSVSLPAGYYSGGTLKGMANDEADADKYKTQTKTVTPTKEQQTVNNDDEYYALDEVIVEAIPAKYQDVTPVSTVPYHVLAGDKYVDSTGAVRDGLMPNRGAVDASIDGIKGDGETEEGSLYYTIPEGYHDGTGRVAFDDSAIVALLDEI